MVIWCTSLKGRIWFCIITENSVVSAAWRREQASERHTGWTGWGGTHDDPPYHYTESLTSLQPDSPLTTSSNIWRCCCCCCCCYCCYYYYYYYILTRSSFILSCTFLSYFLALSAHTSRTSQPPNVLWRGPENVLRYASRGPISRFVQDRTECSHDPRVDVLYILHSNSSITCVVIVFSCCRRRHHRRAIRLSHNIHWGLNLTSLEPDSSLLFHPNIKFNLSQCARHLRIKNPTQINYHNYSNVCIYKYVHIYLRLFIYIYF